jgi:hypothetical protein
MDINKIYSTDYLYLIEKFPNLNKGKFTILKPASNRYNCIALANGDRRRYWCPSYARGFSIRSTYWPDGLPRNNSLNTVVELFRRAGYEQWEGDAYAPIPEIERICLFQR